jgi:hypothetical protein
MRKTSSRSKIAQPNDYCRTSAENCLKGKYPNVFPRIARTLSTFMVTVSLQQHPFLNYLRNLFNIFYSCFQGNCAPKFTWEKSDSSTISFIFKWRMFAQNFLFDNCQSQRHLKQNVNLEALLSRHTTNVFCLYVVPVVYLTLWLAVISPQFVVLLLLPIFTSYWGKCRGCNTVWTLRNVFS